MSREILFKAKRTDTGEWVKGYLWIGNDHAYITPHNLGIFYDDQEQRIKAFAREVDKTTICQYTGLNDKNGKKIWENDIVKKEFYTDYEAFANSEEYNGVVKIQDCAWIVETKRDCHICCRPIFEVMAYSEDVKHFEVIGNIFDNPELLK